MVLRRTLPSRVMVDDATGVAASKSQSAAVSETSTRPNAEETARAEAQAATEAAEAASRAAALAADLDDLPSAPAPQSLEDSFAAQPAPQQTAPESVATPVVAEASAPLPEAAAPAAADPTPSKPQQNGMKRRVREKTARNFDFAASTEVALQPEAQPAAPVAEETSTEDDWQSTPVVSAPLAEQPASSFTAPATTWSPAPVPEAPMLNEAPATPPAIPPMGSLSQQAPAATAQNDVSPASDLPWVNATAGDQEGSTDTWQVETPQVAASSANPYGAQESSAPLDIYGNLGNASSTSAGMPFMNNPASGPAPELPKSTLRQPSAKMGSNTVQWAAGAVVVALVGFAAFQLVKNDESQETVARWTGALTETTEKLPPEMGGAQTNPNADLVAPEQVIAMGDMQQPGILPPPPATSAEGGSQPVTTAANTGGAMIDFADVPPAEAGQKIVADGTQQMPDDIGLIAKFQQAVSDEKARQSGQPAPVPATTAENVPASQEPAQSPGLTPAQKEAQNLALQSKLEAELAAYRQTLATSETPASAPKPTEFFKNPEQFVNGTPPATATPLAPPAATPAEAAQLAPNPNNLPILPEPTAVQEPQIRQLSDFNVELFQDQEERVRIPKGIRPRFASTDFPEMEVLSFVPGRGVIAFNRGREGVLLIGESLEGWELMSVGVDKAEFRNGRRTQYVSAD